MSRGKSKNNRNTNNDTGNNITKKKYNMKSDFLNLAIIILLFTSFLAGLYYYDLQNNILEKMTEQILSLL